MVYPYNEVMKIKVNDIVLPDPSEWDYQVGDLDTSGSRDATGYLHRAYVATKINYEFSWNALEWEMLEKVISAVQDPMFTLTAPDPLAFGGDFEPAVSAEFIQRHPVLQEQVQKPVMTVIHQEFSFP